MKSCILEYLEQTVRRVPERIAFYDDSSYLTYETLHHQAMATGTYLAQKLPVRGIVALIMDGHSLPCIPAMLGVLYAGCAYAPLDPAQPTARLEQILTLMKPDAILTDEKGRRSLQGLSLDLPWIADCLAAAQCPVDEAMLQQVRSMVGLFDPMSVLYTSGSTGIPKGSIQSHSSYIGYTEATNEIYGFDEQVVFGSQSPFFYANSIIDIFPPIALGAKVYLFPAGALAFPKRFLACIRQEHITELTMTPSSFISLVPALEPNLLMELRYIIMSGEMMPYLPLRAWMKAAPLAGYYNFYGSTEAFSVAVGKVEGEHADDEVLPVGRPFRETSIIFMDEDGNENDPCQGGEMLVTSPWISSGYLHDKERTEASFLIDPLNRGFFSRYYRTGDVGRLTEKGELQVLGRRDAQIKHHGYRMELGEVEAVLRSLPGWTDGCVLFDKQQDRLFCFWTGGLTERELHAGLKAKLPRAMLPDRFIHLDEMPHTATMKLDRAVLKQYLDR